MRIDVDANGEPDHEGTDQSPEVLKARIRRLEDALVAMQDTHLMEERVVTRLLERMHQGPTAPPALPAGDEVPSETGEEVDPDAAASARPALPMLTLPPSAAAFFNASLNTAPRTWLIVEIWRELRLMIGMFVDYRFHVGWLVRLAPVLLVVGMLLSWLFLSGLPLIGGVVERVADVVLAVICYKLLAREAARYRRDVGQKPYYRA